MAVGKGSMARASKAAGETTTNPKLSQENPEKPVEGVELTEKKQPSKKKKSVTKKEEKTQEPEVKTADVTQEKQQEKSNVVALGEEMPVYYL